MKSLNIHPEKLSEEQVMLHPTNNSKDSDLRALLASELLLPPNTALAPKENTLFFAAADISPGG